MKRCAARDAFLYCACLVSYGRVVQFWSRYTLHSFNTMDRSMWAQTSQPLAFNEGLKVTPIVYIQLLH